MLIFFNKAAKTFINGSLTSYTLFKNKKKQFEKHNIYDKNQCNRLSEIY